MTANLLGTVAGPAQAALIEQMYPKQQRGCALGLVRGVIGPLLGALMIPTLGVHAVFLTAAASMTIGAWLVSRQLRVMARTELASLAHTRVLG